MILASILIEIHNILIKAGWDDPWNPKQGSQFTWSMPPEHVLNPDLIGAYYHHYIGDTNYELSIHIHEGWLHLDYEDSGPHNWGDLTKFTFDLNDPNSIGQIKAQAAKVPW